MLFFIMRILIINRIKIKISHFEISFRNRQTIIAAVYVSYLVINLQNGSKRMSSVHDVGARKSDRFCHMDCNRCTDLKSQLFAQTLTYVCSLHILNIISQYAYIRDGWRWRFISGCPVGRPFSSFRRTYEPMRRRVLRFPVWRETRLREKKSHPDTGDQDRALWVSQPRPATHGPLLRPCFRTIEKPSQLYRAFEMEYQRRNDIFHFNYESLIKRRAMNVNIT